MERESARREKRGERLMWPAGVDDPLEIREDLSYAYGPVGAESSFA
jgi:hypothetical protein